MFLLMLELLGICHHSLFTFLHMHLFPSMWARGHHLHIDDVDYRYVTLECRVEVEFNQSSCASHHDYNIIEGKLGYIGKIQDIIQVVFSSFQWVIFRFKCGIA